MELLFDYEFDNVIYRDLRQGLDCSCYCLTMNVTDYSYNLFIAL